MGYETICPHYSGIINEIKEYGLKADQIRNNYMESTKYDWKALGWDKFHQDVDPLVREAEQAMSEKARWWMKEHTPLKNCSDCKM